MNGCAKITALFLLAGATLSAGAQSLFESTKAPGNPPLTTDPTSAFWRESRAVTAGTDAHGKTGGRAMQVRSRWTERYLYFLFACPYDQLYLKPSPDQSRETYELWNWDVAEVFIGSDFKDINRYKEFEVSPQGEWIDLDIDLNQPHHEQGWVWNSGFEHDVRIDGDQHIWYAAMKIPMAAIAAQPAVAGTRFRVNLFLSQGPADHHRALVWQPTMSDSFHVPERFGTLKLVP